MKKLLIAILFINMAQAQQTIHVQEISRGTGTPVVRHARNINTPTEHIPSISSPVDLYTLILSDDHAIFTSSNSVIYRVESGSQTSFGNKFDEVLEGRGVYINSNGEILNSAEFIVPEWYSILYSNGWAYNSTGGGYVISPNMEYYVSSFRGEYIVNEIDSNGISIQPPLTSRNEQIGIVTWYCNLPDTTCE